MARGGAKLIFVPLFSAQFSSGSGTQTAAHSVQESMKPKMLLEFNHPLLSREAKAAPAAQVPYRDSLTDLVEAVVQLLLSPGHCIFLVAFW